MPLNSSKPEEREYDYLKHRSTVTANGVEFAERRSAENADEFTRLEVQIAAIFFAFGSFFMTNLKQDYTATKILFTVAIFSLLISLIVGLLHIKRKEMFWNGFVKDRNTRFGNWDEGMRGDKDFDSALTFYKGTVAGKDAVLFTPKWTWITQTVLLFIGVAIMCGLLIAYIFSPLPPVPVVI